MRHHLRTAVGVVLSLLLLIWVLRDVSISEVLHELGSADPLLFSLAILATMVGFWFRAVRWGILLLPLHPALPFRPRFAATVIGFAANNLLPARVGEFARALSLSKLTTVGTGAAFATLVIERMLDGLVVVGLLFVSMSMASFPEVGSIGGVDPRAAALTIAVVVGGMAILMVALVAAPGRVLRLAETLVRVFPPRFRRPLLAALNSFLAGLTVLRSPRLFAVSLVWAIAQWLFLATSFVLAFRAFGITEVDFWGAVFLQSLIGLAVAIPSSPGFFGPFEAAAKIGLGFWGVAPEKAVSFAVGFHIGGFIPVTLIGIYYLWRLNLSWSEVKHSEEAVEERMEEVAASADAAVHDA